MITLYRGDDTGGQLGKNVKIAFHCDDAINMDGVIVHFSLLDIITKEWTNVRDGDILELFVTHEQSGRLPLGSLFGKIWGEDPSGRVRTFANRLPIIVTNDLRKVYGSDGLDSQDIHVYSPVGWDAIANKPTLFPSKIELVEGLSEALDGVVKSVNGKTADAAGAITLTLDSFANDEQWAAINSGIKDYLVPKVLTIDESTATKKIVLGDKTFTSFSELTALVQNGVTRLKYYVTGEAGRPVLYTAHLCDASAIRFDATGTLGETVYTRSIAITKSGDDGIAVSVGTLTQVAKKSDIPSVVAPSASATTGQAADAKATHEALSKVQTLKINDEWRFSVAPGLSGEMAIRLEHLDFPAQGIWGIQTEMTIPTGLGTLVKSADIPEISTTFTEQDAGKAADAKAVGDALDGKLDKSGGTLTGPIDICAEFGETDEASVTLREKSNNSDIVRIVARYRNNALIEVNGHKFLLPTVDHDDAFAILSDITDATKLTPVYDWVDNGNGVIPEGVMVRNVGIPYADDVPDPYHNADWHIDFEMSTDGGELWVETTYTDYAGYEDGKLNFGGFFKFTRFIVGYKLAGDKQSPLLVPVTEKTDAGTGVKTYELPEPIKAALFAGADFTAAVRACFGDAETTEYGTEA